MNHSELLQLQSWGNSFATKTALLFGAYIQYAKAHGIALIQVFDHSCQKYSHSAGTNVELHENDPLKYIEDHWPPYRAICFSDKAEEPVVLYPTTEIVTAIYAGANKLLKEQYGFEVSLPEN